MLDNERRRLVETLMVTAALGGLGQLIGITVASLLVRDMLGTKTWIGTAAAASQLGTAMGAWHLSKYMQRAGRRPGLVIGYLLGAVGAGLILLSARANSYPFLLASFVVYGVGSSSNGASRFSAADLSNPTNRARVVGMVVWASTVGVVLGPKLASPIAKRFQLFAHSQKAGAFVGAGLAFLLCAAILWFFLRPDPLSFAARGPSAGPAAATGPVDVGQCLRRPAVRLAIWAVAAGQVVMVAIMSVTSVHLADHGYTLGGIGTVISGHVLGMFAPSPVTGWICDKVGRLPVIVVSNLIMISAALLAALATAESRPAMISALFLLGIGWNGNFVAGSTLVTDALAVHERPRVQGITDMITQGASGVAALSAGLLVGTTGYPAMAVIGACLALLSTVLVLAGRAALTTPASIFAG